VLPAAATYLGRAGGCAGFRLGIQADQVLGKSALHDDQRRVVFSAYKSRISYGFMAISCIFVVLESVTASFNMILKQNSSKSAFIHHIQRGNRKTDR
jgi:hypothetical protein